MEIEKWCGRTTGAVLRELVSDSKLRAVVAGQRGDYSDPSEASSFGIHAIVMRRYLNEASYPLGGAKVFAEALVPIIENGGGELKLRAHMASLLVELGAVSGVRRSDGSEFRAPQVFSNAGALNTVGSLLPLALRDSYWACEVLTFKPSVCHLALFLGNRPQPFQHGSASSSHSNLDWSTGHCVRPP